MPFKNPNRITRKELRDQLGLEDGDAWAVQLEEWVCDGIVPAVCKHGCDVEPDGTCEHGCPSVLMTLGIC